MDGENASESARAIEGSRVRDLMTADVECVTSDEQIDALATRMSNRRISCVMVADEQRRPIGVITERDLVRSVSNPGRHSRAADLMTSPVLTVPLDASLEEAIALTSERGIRRLAVVDAEGCLVGVVTQTDLIAAHVGRLEQIVDHRTIKLQRANSRLEKVSRADALLGIGNRLALDEDAERLHSVAARYERSYSVGLIDLDHFKQVNDTHGHPVGDDVLRGVAQLVLSCLRASDTFYRMGGDEFVMLMPETDEAGAARSVERVRALVEEHSERLFGVTLSCGVAAFDPAVPRDADPWALISRADKALYTAKQSGRNCVSPVPD